MNEFEKAFEALTFAEASIRCGVSLNSDEETWSLYLKRLCTRYIDSFNSRNI